MNVLARIPTDIVAALLFVALGIAALVTANAYPAGTLTHMGPGFFPRIVAVLFIVLGVAIGAVGRSTAARLQPSLAEARGWLCIVGGIVAFVVLGAHTGLVPATFAIVFISALGSRNNSVKDAALLAAAMVVVSVVIFGLILKIQMPLLGWT